MWADFLGASENIQPISQPIAQPIALQNTQSFNVHPYSQLPKNMQKELQLLYHYRGNQTRADDKIFYFTLNEQLQNHVPEKLDSDFYHFSLEKEYRALQWMFKYHPDMPYGKFGYPLKCVFPERLNFLKKVFQGISNPYAEISVLHCQSLNDFKNGLNAKGLSVVFSSSYPNNPSSMFGHTLLRIVSNEKSPMLDYVVAFSAWQDVNDRGFLQAIKGLVGGYKGLIEIAKYYQKINEYNYIESRDLTEYPIKISKDELDRFINHIWEIYQTTHFDYYFLDENCSSLLYQVLRYAMIDKNLMDEKRIYFLPQELVELLYEQDLLDDTKATLRESLKKIFLHSYFNLGSDGQKKFHDIYGASEIDEAKLQNIESNILDAGIHFYQYQRRRKKSLIDKMQLMNVLSNENKKYQQILMARSRHTQNSQSINANLEFQEVTSNQKKDLIHHAHLPNEFSFGTIFNQKISNTNHLGAYFQFKPVLHSFLDDQVGYIPYQKFDLFRTEVMYDGLSNLELKKFTFVDLRSQHDFSFYDPELSWIAEFTLENHKFSRPLIWTEFSLGYGLGSLWNVDNTANQSLGFFSFYILPIIANAHRDQKNYQIYGGKLLFSANWNFTEKMIAYLELQRRFTNSLNGYDDVNQIETALDRFESHFSLSYNFTKDLSLQLRFERWMYSELSVGVHVKY